MIKYKQNLHTHSIYCDGKNTPEEIVKRAIDLGFDTIGISSHSYMSFNGGGMPEEKASLYKNEMHLLRKKYKDQISVLCGLEFEMYSDGVNLEGYDYVIGSSHYLKIDGKIVGFDRAFDSFSTVIDNYFSGDAIEFAKKYYEDFSQLHKYGNFDIVGHFDLVTKHIDFHKYLDTSSPRYVTSATDCLHELAKHHDVFEVNTGGIARGYRKKPYPEAFILKELNMLKKSVIISSDCHNMEYLDCCFDDAIELIKSCGFNEVNVLTKNGFKGIKI